jgi:tetratricopeptide (TPR) repeat protein
LRFDAQRMHEGRCAAAGLGRPRGGAAATDWPVALEWMVDALQGAFAEIVASDASVHERTQALQRLGQIYGFKVPPLHHISRAHVCNVSGGGTYSPPGRVTALPQGMIDQRVTALERALALKTEEHGADSQQLAHEHGVLGNLLGQMGRFTEALRHLERALALHRSARNPLGEPYEHLVAASMVDVATCHSRMGRHEAALVLLQEAVAVEERLHGPDHKVSLHHCRQS